MQKFTTVDLLRDTKTVTMAADRHPVAITQHRKPKSYLHAIVGAEYLLGLVPRGTHDWQKFITPAELARMCRNAGLETIGSKGMVYNPLSKVYSLSNNVDVNYMVVCRPTAAM